MEHKTQFLANSSHKHKSSQNPRRLFLVKIAKLNLKLYGRVEELEWPRGSRIRTRPEDSTLPEIKIYYSIAFT